MARPHAEAGGDPPAGLSFCRKGQGRSSSEMWGRCQVSEPHSPQASFWAGLAVQAVPAGCPRDSNDGQPASVCVGPAGDGRGLRRKRHLTPSMTMVHGTLGRVLSPFPSSFAVPAVAHQTVM